MIFFDEFEKTVNDLKAADATVDETEKLNYMIKALLKELSYVGDLIIVLNPEERTVDYLKN